MTQGEERGKILAEMQRNVAMKLFFDELTTTLIWLRRLIEEERRK